jgi:hypothetical protein
MTTASAIRAKPPTRLNGCVLKFRKCGQLPMCSQLALKRSRQAIRMCFVNMTYGERRPAVAKDIVKRLRDVTEMSWDGDEITDPLCSEAADEIERLRQVIAKQNGDMVHELLRNEQLCIDLNETQELLARCYTLAVGHGPNFDVFDDWEEAVSAYERETYRGNT